jgi:chromosome segregation ATPase
MSQKLLYLVLIPALFVTCNTKENEVLRSEVDSLKSELQKSYQTSQTLVEVGILLDSIDATRQLLRVNLVEGTPYDDYAGRMENLRQYITTTQAKMEKLEKSLQSSRAKENAFSKTIRQLKAELNARGKEMAFLQEQVEQFRHENENLIITVNLQDAEIADKEEEIEVKSQELALIEARVQELMIQSKVSEGDAYYMRAMAIETAANRTKLAPRKKRETLREALELYKKALSLGKMEAQAKISDLQTRL